MIDLQKTRHKSAHIAAADASPLRGLALAFARTVATATFSSSNSADRRGPR
jgi:hypothetical protein